MDGDAPSSSSALLPRKKAARSPLRWLTLAAFCILTLNNSWMWITWSPVAADVALRWNVSVAEVDALSSVFMWEYIPLSFPALWLLHKIGMRRGLLLGALLNFAGSAIRWRCSHSYALVYVGTVFCSTAQLFTLAVPPLLSHVNFEVEERALATSIGVLANQLGTCAGLGATIVADINTKGTLEYYLGVQSVMALVALVSITAFVHHKPQAEPGEDEAETYLDSLKKIMSGEGLFLNLVYMIVVGVFYAVATFLGQFLGGWPANDVGYLGITLVLGGVVGSTISGVLLDRKVLAFYQMMRVLLCGGFLSSFLFSYAVTSPKQHALIFVATCCFGCFLTAVVSVGMEFGARISPDSDEGIVAGVYNSFAQLGGCIFVWVGSGLLEQQQQPVLLWSFIGAMVVSGVLFQVGVGSLRVYSVERAE